MGVSSKGIGTGAVVWYDTGVSTERWYDALGADVVKFLVNPGENVPVEGWTVTAVSDGAGTSTMVAAATVGVAYLITTAAGEYDGINAQVEGEQFKLEAATELYFGCKFESGEATQCDLVIGLFETLTAILKVDTAHGLAAANVEGAFMYKVDEGTVLTFKTYKDGSETNTATYGTAFDTTATIFEMYWDGSQLKGYVDGSLVGTFTGDLPDGDLTPSIDFRAGGDAVETLKIYWLRAIECR